MPRFPRSYIETKYFHVIVQGINKNYIFNNPEDIKYYIKILYEFQKEYPIDIIAYCIMNNHAHMLLKIENLAYLSKFMHRVNTKYAMYYNQKYNRVGYVFRDRYKSEGIYSEEHLYNCVKYIYNNPVKAKICDKPEDYQYSNYRKINQNFSDDNQYVFLDVDDNKKDSCKKIIEQFLEENKTDYIDLKDNERMLRRLLIILKDDYKISLRQIAKELKIGREKIRNIYKY